MAEQPALSFAGLLRQLRAEAKLTQEELAEVAGLSPRSISDLERGVNRTARKYTALVLADALSLTGPTGKLFVAAARGRAPAAEVLAAREEMRSAAPAAAATRTLPRDVASFTGRGPEFARLMDVAADAAAATSGGVVRICVIGGMAGPARPRSPCTPRTCWGRVSLMARFSCRCTAIRRGSGQWIRSMRWKACC